MLYNTYRNKPEHRRSHITGGSISNNLENEQNTYYYADAKNTDSQVIEFQRIGAVKNEIIVEKDREKLTERIEYQRLRELLQPGDTLVICSLHILGSKYTVRSELTYYREHHIRVKILDMSATLQDFPEEQEFLYGVITDTIIQTLDTVIRQERQRIKRQQRRGIETLKESIAWEGYGRPSVTLPDNYAEVMNRWLSGKITAAAAMNLTGLKRTTFYKLAKEYKEGELQV